MRFLMLNWRDPHNPRAGGAERVSRGYLAYLAQRGHEVAWFCPLFPGAPAQETIDGIQMVRSGHNIWQAIPAARRWVRRQPRFDLVMDQHHGVPWYAPWWCRTNCVAYIHEVLGPIWNAFYHWPYNVVGRWQERLTHSLYWRVPFWTASAATRQSLVAAGVRSVTVIPYGVHTQALPALDPKPLGQPLRLITVSRLAPNKRVDHALQAVKLLAGHGLIAHLTVVGIGEIEPQIRQLAADLQLSRQVTFTGLLDEVDKDAALRQAHLLLHTSLREGWGLNVIEANAMGTPAVVYPVPGLVESTLHNETGLVTRSETPEALVASLQEILQHPDQYEVFRQHAWRRAGTFHWSQVLPRAADWLEQQASGNRRHR